MKHTKNMVYKETEESRELFLYTINDSETYYRHTVPLIDNYSKKMIKGKYDPEKAVDGWYYVATAGSDHYNKEFGFSFNVQQRFTVAVELESYYREQIEYSVKEMQRND